MLLQRTLSISSILAIAYVANVSAGFLESRATTMSPVLCETCCTTHTTCPIGNPPPYEPPQNVVDVSSIMTKVKIDNHLRYRWLAYATQIISESSISQLKQPGIENIESGMVPEILGKFCNMIHKKIDNQSIQKCPECFVKEIADQLYYYDFKRREWCYQVSKMPDVRQLYAVYIEDTAFFVTSEKRIQRFFRSPYRECEAFGIKDDGSIIEGTLKLKENFNKKPNRCADEDATESYPKPFVFSGDSKRDSVGHVDNEPDVVTDPNHPFTNYAFILKKIERGSTSSPSRL